MSAINIPNPFTIESPQIESDQPAVRWKPTSASLASHIEATLSRMEAHSPSTRPAKQRKLAAEAVAELKRNPLPPDHWVQHIAEDMTSASD